MPDSRVDTIIDRLRNARSTGIDHRGEPYLLVRTESANTHANRAGRLIAQRPSERPRASPSAPPTKNIHPLLERPDSTFPRARKDTMCTQHGHPIRKGERYHRWVGTGDEWTGLATIKECAACCERYGRPLPPVSDEPKETTT